MKTGDSLFVLSQRVESRSKIGIVQWPGGLQRDGLLKKGKYALRRFPAAGRSGRESAASRHLTGSPGGSGGRWFRLGGSLPQGNVSQPAFAASSIVAIHSLLSGLARDDSRFAPSAPTFGDTPIPCRGRNAVRPSAAIGASDPEGSRTEPGQRWHICGQVDRQLNVIIVR